MLICLEWEQSTKAGIGDRLTSPSMQKLAHTTMLYICVSNKSAEPGTFVYQNGPEWGELPEWTTGMDLNMCP